MTSITEHRADLEHYRIGDLDDIDPETDQPPVLEGIDQADRALRKLGRIDASIRQIENIAADEKQRIDDWKTERLSVLGRELEFWTRCVETWARQHHAETGIKTHKLPAGVLQLRKLPDKVDVDPTKVETAPERLVKVERKWDRQAVKNFTTPSPEPVDETDTHLVYAAVTVDGELVDGVFHLVAKAPSFKATPDGAA